MSLLKKIDENIIKALKAGEKEKLTVLRGLKSDLKYRQIDGGKELTDEICLEVFQSAMKKRKDSIEQFRAGNREDLVRQEEFAVEIIAEYLPEQISDDELLELIKAAIAETGADSPQKIGLIMKVVIPQVKGRADGKRINQIAIKLLTA